MYKKTHSQYVEELAIKNPNVEVVETYITANTPIMHRCLIHNIEWKTTPSRVLNNKGCALCHSEKIKHQKTRTHDEFLNELNKVAPYIQVIDKYENCKVPILCYCTIHKIKWKALPDSLLQGHGCKECGKMKTRNKNTKPYDEYLSQLKNINTNVECIGEYINSTTKTLHKCKRCGFEWLVKPSNVLIGSDCPKCFGNIKKTNDEYILQLHNKLPHLVLLEDYKNANTPLKHKCIIHNYEFISNPHTVINSCGCKYCGIETATQKRTTSHEDFIQKVYNVNPYIQILNKYINSAHKIQCKCLHCGYVWNAYPYNLLNGCGCPQCKESKGERSIRLWLNNHNIKYEFQKRFKDCRNKKPLPFDFYLPEYNTCIEYDGMQHFKSVDYFGGEKCLEALKKCDTIKNEYCKNHDIGLLRISYNDNITDKLQNYLLA